MRTMHQTHTRLHSMAEVIFSTLYVCELIVLATITLTIKHGNSYGFDLEFNPTKISTENMAAEISVC